MRLLYITAGYPFGGTGEAFLEPELAALAALGVQIDVLPVRRTGRAADRCRPVSACGPRPSAGPGAASPAAADDEAWALTGVVAGSPRCVPRNLAVLPLATAVAAATADEGDYDHIHAHWLTHTSTCALSVSRLTGTPFSITAHRWDVYVDNLFAAKVQHATFIRFIARACRTAFEAQVGRRAGRLVDLHMGVEIPAPAAQAHEDVVGEPLRLVTVGSLLPVKGQQHMVEAMALLRDRGIDATLDVFGDGPLRAARRAGHPLGLTDRVVLRGERPRAELSMPTPAATTMCS